jgi:hypothetical protein
MRKIEISCNHRKDTAEVSRENRRRLRKRSTRFERYRKFHEFEIHEKSKIDTSTEEMIIRFEII